MKRLRWWIADQLNRLPGQCWADLVSWVLSWPAGEKRSLWSPVGDVCRQDAAANGTCYCGKLRAGRQPAPLPAGRRGHS